MTEPINGRSMEVEAASSLTPEGKILPYGMINQTELSTGSIAADPQMREIAGQLSRWIDNARSAIGATSMFDRGMFTPPDNPYDEMRAARNAVLYDSIVAGVAETTEAFAFQGVKWEGEDADEADVFNQMSRDMNLDAVVRAMWREEFTYGQCVVAKIWGWREFTVRGATKNGNQRKRKFRVWAPLQMRVLDPAKVVPVGVGPLGGEQLAWQASLGEIGYYQSAYAGNTIDPLMITFFQGTYIPSFDEQGQLGKLGVDTSRLLLMNPEFVFRHTLTKPDYERFADIRLKSLFTILDMKRQLMQADRAHLIGAANYILLIRKGAKEEPALPAEMAHLRENYNYIAKMPVIISDHRLSIDIIAPKVDFTLDGPRYDVLDSRLLARLLGTLTLGGKGQRNETQETLSVAVARTMENRRHMLKRTLELELARAVVQHPRNAGVFKTEPNLVYMPRNIALAMDPAYLQGLQNLRTQREISRETILEFMGLDEATEAQRLEMEAEMFDDIFKTEIPFNGPGPGDAPDPALDKKDAPAAITVAPDGTLKAQPAAPGKAPAKATPAKPAGPNGGAETPSASGARGGRPAGGGNSTQSPAAQAKPKTPRGNPRTGGK